jgi:exonuclease V gamma subunit
MIHHYIIREFHKDNIEEEDHNDGDGETSACNNEAPFTKLWMISIEHVVIDRLDDGSFHRFQKNTLKSLILHSNIMDAIDPSVSIINNENMDENYINAFITNTANV